jgi:peptidoglycan/LPS O-acetylase OafA/YrhL
VEASFYVILPLLAYLLLVVLCRRQWRPKLLLAGIGGLALISPAWLVVVHLTTSIPNGARLWLPTYLIWFLAGMALTVLQRMRVRCYAFVALPLATICYFIASTPLAGDPTTSPLGMSQALYKAGFYAVIAALAVAPLALGNEGLYARLLASRPMVWLGEISYEIFLIHLVTMEFAMVYIMQDHVYTGSMGGLFVATMAITIPPAWLLHRFTRVRG